MQVFDVAITDELITCRTAFYALKLYFPSMKLCLRIKINSLPDDTRTSFVFLLRCAVNDAFPYKSYVGVEVVKGAQLVYACRTKEMYAR